MEELYLIESGIRRRAKESLCKNCEQKFLQRINGKQKYCSASCASSASRVRIKFNCAWCQKEGEKPASRKKFTKSGLQFCNRKCKEEAQKIGGIKEIMPSHYKNGKWVYRNWFQKSELVCHRCGYNEFPSSVAIHHIDENRNNNSKENLIPLCMNCHQGLHSGFWKLGL